MRSWNTNWARRWMLVTLWVISLGWCVDASEVHWAYRPLRATRQEVSGDSGNGVDGFLDEALLKAGLKPGGEADRRTLLRRLSFDLTGLPPTEEEMRDWLRDETPDAYQRQVERLLGSRHFGEHWARHWFDMVRFGESVTLRGFIFKQAWRYRDYVIASLNEDRPMDQMIREHLAGDLMQEGTLEEQQKRMVATTFLMLGNTNLEEQDKKQLEMDVVDEQLDVIGKAFLGQTLSCARCHDHKFDPIPTQDYYAMAGILKGATVLRHENVSVWMESALPLEQGEMNRFVGVAREAELTRVEIQVLKEKIQAAKQAGGKSGVSDANGVLVDDVKAKRVGQWTESRHNTPYVGDGYLHDGNGGKGEKTLTFQPELPRAGKYEVRFGYTSGGNRAGNVPVTVFHADGETLVRVDERKEPGLDRHYVSLGVFRFETSGFSHVLVSNEGTDGHVIADAVQFVLVSGSEPDRVVAKADPNVEQEGNLTPEGELKELEGRLKKLEAELAKRPMVMVPAEVGAVVGLEVHRRGSVHQLGEKVERGYLSVLKVEGVASPSRRESGRRELAEWLVSSSNPLTPRVMANRIWLWLMGEGLVRTPDNFGTTGDIPVQAELLDWLAHRLTEGAGSGVVRGKPWSIKGLVREIVQSRAYRRASVIEDGNGNGAVESQVGQRGFVHGVRKRLSAEQLRDTFLWVSGELKLEPRTGPSFPADRAADFGYQNLEHCRSIYLPWFRNAMPDLFTLFDFPAVAMVTGQRDRSTVPTQSLYLMNDPYVRGRAVMAAKRWMGERSGLGGEQGVAGWVNGIYLRVLGREAKVGEVETVRRLVVGRERELERWADVFQALMASPEFRLLN